MTKTIAELQIQIEREQKLLLQYEEMEGLENDPRRRLRLQENIEEAKQHILTFETRIVQIRAENIPPAAMQLRESTFIANVPYGLETELYGREQELALLDDWFHRDPAHPLLAVIGLGGQGKSALTWQWQKQLQADRLAPPLVVWWSFYEQDGTMQALLRELLTHFGDVPTRFGSLRQAVDRLRQHLGRTPALILLDGAERLLRAYSSMGVAYQGDDERDNVHTASLERQQLRQCVDPAVGILLQWLAEPGLIQARTLLTSRLFPQELAGRSGLGLQGVRRHDLTGLNNEAAYALFRSLGIGTTRAEVRAACEPLGYHPLSLRLLARAVRYSPTAPNDLQAAATYDPSSDLLGKREHVLQRAYDNLPKRGQNLLSLLAALRSSVPWQLVETIFCQDSATYALKKKGNWLQGLLGRKPRSLWARLRQDELLAELVRLEQRGLLQRTERQIEGDRTQTYYDLHPIVRRYSYDRLPDQGATHGQLVAYFEDVPEAQRIRSLEDLAPAIELYHHLTRAGRYDEACDLFSDKLASSLYFQLGAYQTRIELLLALFPNGVDKLPRLSKEADQAWTLNELAISYGLAGRPSAAVPLFEQDIAICEKQDDKRNQAIGLGNLAAQQLLIGKLTAAAHNLCRRISLCREIEDRLREAVGHQEYGLLLAITGNRLREAVEHQEYGRLLATTGNWDEAQSELDASSAYWEETKDYQGLCLDWAYRAQAALLQGEEAAALRAAQEALRLADEDAHTSYPVERDYVRAYWLLGWARLGLGELPAAQGHLDESLRRCRAISLVELEPAILLAQARLAAAQSQLPLARTLVGEAQHIAVRAGYVLNLADIQNFLAQLALDAGQREEAGRLAQQAHDYAWCDGPPYAYQPALDEAERLLELLKS